MRNLYSKINNWLTLFGIDVKKFFRTFHLYIDFIGDYRKMKKLLHQTGNLDFKINKLFPVLGEKFSHSTIPWNYFFQDLWVAQQIFQNKPVKHVDVGSRIDGFVSHVAAFRKIEVYDIRSVREDITNVHFVKADICSESFSYNDYCDSISSLHVIEHLGLGRYGDELDPDGHLKGLRNIARALKTGGIFYFSVPIGEQRIEFNAHRVFSTQYILDILTPFFHLESFSYINDESNFFPLVSLDDPGFGNSFSCHYGCGIFVLRKTGNWI